MLPTLRFEAPGVPTLSFDVTDGWAVDVFDIGSPAIREVELPVPDADGIDDSTLYIGARDLIVRGHVAAESWSLSQQQDRLRAFLSPRLRTDVFYAKSGEDERVFRGCRAVSMPGRVVAFDDDTFEVVLRCPSGVAESAVEQSFTAFPGAGSGGAGLTLPTTLPIKFVGAGAPGSTTVTNSGTFEAMPLLKVFGPCEGFTVENRTTGRALVFASDFGILAGEYLEIDTRGKTIRLNGFANQSRYDQLDFAESAWWGLVPGVNDVRFTADSSSVPAQVQGVFRSAWI